MIRQEDDVEQLLPNNLNNIFRFQPVKQINSDKKRIFNNILELRIQV
jgi:hypothetical protein